jgi:hypothetical protein
VCRATFRFTKKGKVSVSLRGKACRVLGLKRLAQKVSAK